MCGLHCLDSAWQPSIYPHYLPPRGGGWSISTLPEAFSSDPEWERLQWGWSTRQKQGNNSPSEAVNEMVRFLEQNNVKVTREVKGEIRSHADREWCSRDPKRCPKKPTGRDPYETLALQRGARTQPSSVGCGGCGGGRIV